VANTTIGMLLGAILLLVPVIPEVRAAEKESKLVEDTRTYKFAVTDIVGLEELQREFTAFQNTLEKTTGYHFQLFPVTGRTVVVESFRSQRLDFALIGPAEYVAIRSRTNVSPLIGLKRENYRSALITRKQSGIISVGQLVDKKIAFGDFGSTSYHLAPLQLLADDGVLHQKTSTMRTVNLNKYVAWKSLLRKQVDAIGFNLSRFEQFIDEDPKLHREDFTVLATTPDLPSDLFVAGKHVPIPVQEKLREVFEKEGALILEAMLHGKRNAKYLNMSFKTDITDNDYGYIRKMYVTAGLETLAGHS